MVCWRLFERFGLLGRARRGADSLWIAFRAAWLNVITIDTSIILDSARRDGRELGMFEERPRIVADQ